MLKTNIIEKLNQAKNDFLDNEKKLSSMEIISDSKKFTELSIIQKKLSNIVELYEKYNRLSNEVNEIKLLLTNSKSPENEESSFKNLLIENENNLQKIEKQIFAILTTRLEEDERSAIFEIKKGIGGDEAGLFAKDLFWMYHKYCSKNGFKIDVLSSEPSDHGGYSSISFEVSGLNAYKTFKYESGVHRVQREPQTESLGRIHTSTATIFVFPKAQEKDFVINTNDLKIETFRSGGAGGQHVNKTESAIRITHIPSGVVVVSQDGRSQHINKENAMKVLRSKLYELELQKRLEKENKQRKFVTGSRERSEKIRTYNYPDNRVTDHRIPITIKKLDQIISGNVLNELLEIISTISDDETL